MSARADATVPSTRRPRKSTGHSPVRKRMEKENMTVDVPSSLAGNGGRKNSRSKSMGSGGLDALKPGTGNRRVSLAAPSKPLPRSILKPTLPIAEIPPHKPGGGSRDPGKSSSVQGVEDLPNPFQNGDTGSSGKKIALRTEEEQQAAVREREEQEKVRLEQEIKDRREARRKSLANRRVSFAAEATLHTFHDVEYMQDSTTSTESTRRASSLPSQSPGLEPAEPRVTEATDPPSIPSEQAEDLVPESPAHQRDVQPKKCRRSSAVPPLSFNNPDDVTLGSSICSSDSEAADGVIEAHEEVESNSGSDSDSNDGPSMDLVTDEVTGTSVASAASVRSVSTAESNSTLDDALRLAAKRAETQNSEEEEIIPSFGWGKKFARKEQSPGQDDSTHEDSGGVENDGGTEVNMEMTNAVGGIIASKDSALNDEEISMDVTAAFGGILPRIDQMAEKSRRQSESPRKSFGDSSGEDATMDLTLPMGGIRGSAQKEGDLLELESNEDLSMELTTSVGGVLPQNKTSRNVTQRQSQSTMAVDSDDDDDDDTAMDMTVGVGHILPAGETAQEDEATAGMDMTMAMGRVIKAPTPLKDHTQGKQMLEEEVDKADSFSMLNSPSNQEPSAAAVATGTSETGSPGIAFRGKGLRRSIDRKASVTPKAGSLARKVVTPKPASPPKVSSSKNKGPSTPSKTTPSESLRPFSTSPDRSPARTTKTTPTSAQKWQKTTIFKQDASTGIPAPRVILTPQKRRLSGLGADRPGLGSPKVTEIFDRRESIGEAAGGFVSGHARDNSRNVTFADPRAMEDEIDRQRLADEDRENGRRILEREADGQDDENSTATLKDMISSMTPKKDHAIKGRKSLHVGSARGLLGKRPAELDYEDEGEDRDGVKRLKGHHSSPVKNVRLDAPPTKAETTGRTVRSSGRHLEETSANITKLFPGSSPQKASKATSSPIIKGHFKDIESDQAVNTVESKDSLPAADPDPEYGERIHLQDFLNMTSIRFMELTTTKRRHTQAAPAQKDAASSGKEDVSLESCVVAGACTVPMLELYQHSCRELKKYISEGRRIVREIETETFEDNPPLFQEYMSASPEFKILMDNQFKNVKTHARLLSKAMWYEWRMKLQDGLKEGLLEIAEGMDADKKLVRRQQELLDSVLPALNKRFEELRREHGHLESAAQELAQCDPKELEAVRAELSEVDSDVESKLQKIEELRQELQETESAMMDKTEKKQQCLSDIAEADKTREECRGWTCSEIKTLKARVDKIEKIHGWTITGIAGTTVSMMCLREIELVFDVAAFQGVKPNSRIDLWYIAAHREPDARPATPEKEFFVQAIRDHVRGRAQAGTGIRDLLRMVRAAWLRAGAVSDNMRLLNVTFPTDVSKTSDSSIAIRASLLLAPLETKVEIVLGLHAQNADDGVHVAVVPQARVVYGEHFKVDKMTEFLASRIGSEVVAQERAGEVESWSDVVVDLQQRLLARGQR